VVLHEKNDLKYFFFKQSKIIYFSAGVSMVVHMISNVITCSSSQKYHKQACTVCSCHDIHILIHLCWFLRGFCIVNL